MDKVIDRMHEWSKGSWERATAVEAELEYHHPSFSPFSAADTSALLDIPPVLLSLVKQIVADKPTAESFPRGKGLILVEDDAAGDPASLGTHCLTVLNYLARKQEQGTSDGAKQDFLDQLRKAIDDEMLFLLEHAPKTEDGAISHRIGHVSLWADFIYMVPPFMATYALSSDSPRVHLNHAYEQCRLYRSYFKKPNSGLWRHIIFGGEKIGGDRKVDPWAWSTSNGWVAAGLVRTRQIFLQSPIADEMGPEIEDLLQWTLEIMNDVVQHQAPSGMIRTYIDEEHTPEESCGTALLAYVGFRLATMQLGHRDEYIPFALKAREAVLARIDSDTGTLKDVCDIVDERMMRSESAEGQAFVVLLEAAARDWFTLQDQAKALIAGASLP